MERFVLAQDNNLGYGYSQALEEVKAGKKQNHWIWYIFPQLQRLGTSRRGIYYGIWDRREAASYLNHPVLGKRLREITGVLLSAPQLHPAHIFGERDSLKVKSCMTLFDDISPCDIFGEVLEVFYSGERCSKTQDLLYREKNPILNGPFVYNDVGKIDEVVEKNFLDKSFNILPDKDEYYSLRSNAGSLKAVVLSANFFSDSLISKIDEILAGFDKNNILGTIVYMVNSGADNASLVPISLLQVQRLIKTVSEQASNAKFGVAKNLQTKYAPETQIAITIIVGYF